MRFDIQDNQVSLWLSPDDTERWASQWPCSFLSGKRLFAAFDTNGLTDVAVNSGKGDQDCPADEFNAITSYYLASCLLPDHPCYEVSVDQFGPQTEFNFNNLPKYLPHKNYEIGDRIVVEEHAIVTFFTSIYRYKAFDNTSTEMMKEVEFSNLLHLEKSLRETHQGDIICLEDGRFVKWYEVDKEISARKEFLKENGITDTKLRYIRKMKRDWHGETGLAFYVGYTMKQVGWVNRTVDGSYPYDSEVYTYLEQEAHVPVARIRFRPNGKEYLADFNCLRKINVHNK